MTGVEKGTEERSLLDCASKLLYIQVKKNTFTWDIDM